MYVYQPCLTISNITFDTWGFQLERGNGSWDIHGGGGWNVVKIRKNVWYAVWYA